MTDEVVRLRRLRRTALKVRALARSLRTGKQDDGLYEGAALLHWRLARIATGRLRSHPYESFQKDQGAFERHVDRVLAHLTAKLANVRGRGLRVFLAEAGAAARELDDTRALTLSTDLSDALGRVQQCMRELIAEAQGHAEIRTGGHERSTEGVAASPYIAL